MMFLLVFGSVYSKRQLNDNKSRSGSLCSMNMHFALCVGHVVWCLLCTSGAGLQLQADSLPR